MSRDDGSPLQRERSILCKLINLDFICYNADVQTCVVANPPHIHLQKPSLESYPALPRNLDCRLSQLLHYLSATWGSVNPMTFNAESYWRVNQTYLVSSLKETIGWTGSNETLSLYFARKASYESWNKLVYIHHIGTVPHLSPLSILYQNHMERNHYHKAICEFKINFFKSSNLCLHIELHLLNFWFDSNLYQYHLLVGFILKHEK